MRGDATSLAGLRVIGFHGAVGERQTPARVAPVYVDADDHFVGVHLAIDGEVTRERSDVRFDPATFGEYATRIEPDLPARAGWFFVVVGAREREHMDLFDRGSRYARRIAIALRAAGDAGEVRRVSSNVAPYVSVALYLSPIDAALTWSEIGAVARAHLGECCERGADAAAIADGAWWVKNAAADRNDVLRAIASLERAGSRHASALAHSYLREGKP